jgi:signal peptidase I
MENTLTPNQYVLVDKLTPRFDDYHHDDIVVFSPPADWAHDAADTPHVKRVSAWPATSTETAPPAAVPTRTR